MSCYRRLWHLAILCVLLSALLPIATPSFALTNYTDPVGYPAPWPSALTTQAYTSQGNPQYDLTGNPDGSRGASLSGSVDFSSGPSNNQPSIYYYGNGSILFFRLRVDGPPTALTGNGQPFTSATWNLLLDIDGDGFKEFVIMLDGEDSGTQPDDIVVIYDNANSQKFVIAQTGIWRQDCAGTSDGVDGSSGNSSTWDSNPNAYVWDFGRTRVTQIDTTKAAGSNLSEYFIDIQVPLSALNATAIGGPALTTNTPLTILATTSNSNTDPTQKDVLYAGSLTVGDVALPGGDLTNGTGTIIQAPLITAVTSIVTCPVDTLKATVLDATTTVSGQTKDTISSVTFQYFLDANNNGQADDAGQQWTLIGSASRTSTLGLWQAIWDLSQRANGTYLVRAVATDNQGNTTYSTDQSFLSPSSVTATVSNTCSAVPSFAPSSKTTVDLGSPVVPGSFITYQIVVKNGGGATANNVVIRDTLSTSATYVANSASPDPSTIDSVSVPGTRILIWNYATVTAGQIKTITFRVQVKSPLPNQTPVNNTAWITSNETAPLAVSVGVTITSLPDVVLTKGVSSTLASPGDTLTYTVTYSNQGTDTATLLVITDSSPSATTYIPNSVIVNSVQKTDAADGDNVTVSSGSITINVGTVPAGGSGQIQFRARVQ